MNDSNGNFRVNGSSVRRARFAAGLRQEDVARMMADLGWHLSQPMVSQVEGDGRCLNEPAATALAAILRVGLPQIAGGRVLSGAATHRVEELAAELRSLAGPPENHPGATKRAA